VTIFAKDDDRFKEWVKLFERIKFMANSGIAWVDTTFNWSVISLYEVAGVMDITF